MIDINLLYENITEEQSHIDEFNRMLGTLSEKKRKMCTILPTDSGNKIRKKCKVASVWGIHHAPVWDRYMTQPGPLPDTGSGDVGDVGGDGMGEEILSDAKSSTERVRKYYRKHPGKVKSYLRKTVKDRTARNRDRRKAVKKHGKSKMKNHDVHHPKGPNGGSWRLAKKDHGPDKKNENIIPRSVISEGGAAGLDYVKCKVCNVKLKQIQYRHLNTHNMTMEQYTQKYPDAQLVAENSKNYMGSGKNPMESAISRKKISDALKGTDKCAHFGDKNPMKREDVREKFRGDKNPAKREENRKKISDGVLLSYNNPKLLQTRSAAFSKFRNSDEYKERMYELKLWTRPEDKPSRELYEQIVRDLSNINYRQYFNQILEAKSRSKEWHLDHKLSIQHGFDNKIHPAIIAHPSNLEIMHHSLNESKGIKSSILYEELLANIKEFDSVHGGKTLLLCGGAAGHMAHPYEDDSLKFSDIKTMIQRGLVGGLDAEAPVSEKLDGQNIMFSIRDGQVIFARNDGHIKNSGKNALNTQDLRQKFAGRGDVEKAFGGAAEDLQAAVDALPQEQKDAMFGGGSKFMNVEIIFPDTKNVIPYDKSVLVFHGTVEYDKDGNEVGRNADDGKTLSNQITKVNAQQQKTFGISGPRTISFSDADTIANKKRMRKYASELARLQNEFKLDDNSTIQDYKREWWSREIDRMAVDWTPEEKEGLISRWAFGEKTFGVKHITDPEKKKFFRAYEQNDLKRTQQIASRPLESIFLRVGADTLRRVTNTLSANNPKLAASLKDELLKTIQDLKATDDEDKLAKLQIQIERLDDLGIDSVVPSEGLVFIYNGKPYKFTGAFAPVNQILGTLKFAKGKAEEPEAPAEPTKKPVAVKSAPTQPVAPTAPAAVQPAPVKRRTVAIFTGRFQPFHAGHYSIYQSMVDKFGKDNVFIATSDRTDPTTSPFGFNEKKDIMTTMFDIPRDVVVKVKNPYAPTEILSKLPPETVYVTAVSQKDADRLSHGKYFRPYDSTPERGKKSYNTQGYLIVAPELQLQVNGKNISGTQLRAVMGDPNITDRAKEEVFTKIYGKFDKKIFSKIVKKTTDSEVARQVTKTYVPKKEKPAGKQPAKKKPKGPGEAEVELDRVLYKPGSVWTTDNGKFGGKNSKSKIGYFSTKEKATIYAKK